MNLSSLAAALKGKRQDSPSGDSPSREDASLAPPLVKVNGSVQVGPPGKRT